MTRKERQQVQAKAFIADHSEREGQESWDSSLEVRGMIITHSQPLALKHLISLVPPFPG